jgi:hypothetical protein
VHLDRRPFPKRCKATSNWLTRPGRRPLVAINHYAIMKFGGTMKLSTGWNIAPKPPRIRSLPGPAPGHQEHRYRVVMVDAAGRIAAFLNIAHPGQGLKTNPRPPFYPTTALIDQGKPDPGNLTATSSSPSRRPRPYRGQSGWCPRCWCFEPRRFRSCRG